MEKRLLGDEFGLKRSGEQWLDAWNLGKTPAPAKADSEPEKKAA
jgi:hypothetical protein